MYVDLETKSQSAPYCSLTYLIQVTIPVTIPVTIQVSIQVTIQVTI